MSYENLILGVLFSIGIFAVKSGVGISYIVAGKEKRQAKISAFSFFVLTYGLVFAAVAWVITGIDFIRHLNTLQSLVRSGMIVHMSLAVLLAVWGVLLLKNRGRRRKSKGWLLLALPCPVCAIVILFSAGFLSACFPDKPKLAVLALYLAFVLINIVTMGVIGWYRKGRSIPSESILGGAMLLIAFYFMVSVTVMPQFADVDKIYRLARYQGGVPSQEVLHLMPFWVLGVAAFFGGFGLTSKTIRRST
jgi:predicted transporter